MAASKRHDLSLPTSAEVFKDSIIICSCGDAEGSSLFLLPTSNSSSSISPYKQSCQHTREEQKQTTLGEAKSPEQPKTFAIGMMETDPAKEAEKRAARLARFGPVGGNDPSLIRSSGGLSSTLLAAQETGQAMQFRSSQYGQRGLKRDYNGHIKVPQSFTRGRSRVKLNTIADRHPERTKRRPRSCRNI
jgi:hypothetical protein